MSDSNGYSRIDTYTYTKFAPKRPLTDAERDEILKILVADALDRVECHHPVRRSALKGVIRRHSIEVDQYGREVSTDG